MNFNESVEAWFGPIERRMGEDDSVVLSRLPKNEYPDPDPACATCPAKDWYLTKKALRCFCKEHQFISWVSNEDPVLVCDARERLIKEADMRASAGR